MTQLVPRDARPDGPAEVVPRPIDLWREGPGYCITGLRIPMQRGLLGEARAYLVSTSAGHLLVDTGPGDERAASALDEQLARAGVEPKDLTMVIVTHAHPDHMGSATRLQALGTRIFGHRADAGLYARRAADPTGYRDAVARWLTERGAPREDAAAWAASLAGRYERVRYVPDAFLGDDEEVRVGDLRLRATWTPGHTPGHLILTLPHRRLLFVGDHVLPSLAPNVGEAPDTPPNPLPAYLDSLRRLGRLRDVVGLPGHGDPFDVGPRAQALAAHQTARGRLVRQAVREGAHDANTVAARLWDAATWATFTPLLKTNAIATVSAHLARLEARAEIVRETWRSLQFHVIPAAPVSGSRGAQDD